VDQDFWGDVFPTLLSDGSVQMAWESTPRSSETKVVAAFSAGEAAQTPRRWSTSSRDAHYVSELRHNLPNLDRHLRSSVWFHDWNADRWTGSSYSFPAPGEITKFGAMLAAGIGALHFAGEHTCYPFAGYMEGALRSGLRVAEHLCARDAIVKADAGGSRRLLSPA
jgi:monoamine oxidase